MSRPERRLTKIKKSTSRHRPLSTEYDGNIPLSKTQENLLAPMASFDSSRSASTTRLDMRSHSSRKSAVSPIVQEEHLRIDSAMDHTDSKRRPQRTASARPVDHTMDDEQAIDVPRAIALLQELRKHATAEELVALHKALLPTRNSVENLAALPQAEGYGSYRRSNLLPGLATRGGPGSDPLQTIEELVERRRSHRQSLLAETARQSTLQLPEESHRPVSPLVQEELQAGVYRTGTLRITNRSPSPASTVQPYHGLDGTIDERVSPLTAESPMDKQMRNMPAFASSTTTLNAAMEEYSDMIGNPYDRQSRQPPPDTHSQASSSCESFKTPVEAPAQAMLRRFASLERMTQEVYSSSDEATVRVRGPRPALAHAADSGYASEVSSDRQSHSLESKRKPDPLVLVQEVAKPPSRPAPAVPTYRPTNMTRLKIPRPCEEEDISALPQLPSPEPVTPPAKSPRTPRAPPPEIADLLGIRPVRKPSSKPPKSPKSVKSTKSMKSYTTEHDPLPDALPQRLEDLFVAPEEPRPKSRRRTLLSSLGFGKKEAQPVPSLNAHRDITPTSLASRIDSAAVSRTELTLEEEKPKSVKPIENKSVKPVNKLKKSAPRHVKQARKELAKFEAASQEDVSTPVQHNREKSLDEDQEEDDQFDAQPDWFWQDDYSMPNGPTSVWTVQQPPMPDRNQWQSYPHPSRRRRNLSVVQEIDHDSIADIDSVRDISSRGEQFSSPPPARSQIYQLSELSFTPGLGLDQSNLLEDDGPLPMPPDRRAFHQPNPSVTSTATFSSLTSGQLELIEEVQNATIDWAVQAKFWRARRTLVGHALGEEKQDGPDPADPDITSKFQEVGLPPIEQSSFPKRNSSMIQPADHTSKPELVSQPLLDRYSGGLQYEWTREVGINGSAGTTHAGAVENGRSAPSKVQYGLDLSDVPVFITKR